MKRSLPVLAATAALCVLLSSRSFAQAVPAAHGGGELRVGLTYSNASTDEVTKRIGGASAYADLDLGPHLGIEANIHLLQFQTPLDYAQRSYLVGVRYIIIRKGRFEPYAKALGGIGQTVAQSPYANGTPGTPGTYAVVAGGGGLDIRIPHKLTVRAFDYEFQRWPSFEPNGLNPQVLSFGLSYQIR